MREGFSSWFKIVSKANLLSRMMLTSSSIILFSEIFESLNLILNFSRIEVTQALKSEHFYAAELNTLFSQTRLLNLMLEFHFPFLLNFAGFRALCC